MLKQEQIEYLQKASEDISVPITEFLIRDIAQRTAAAGKITATGAYEIYRAESLGKSRKKIKKFLSKQLKLSKKQIDELFKQAARTSYNYDVQNINTLSLEENTSLQQMVQAASLHAQTNFTNLTRTLGMVAPNGIAYPLRRAYLKTIDYAFEKVFTGASDYNSAIRAATKNIAEMGVRVINYESGVHTSLEAATRRNVLGGIGLMLEKVTQQVHDENGFDGWEISAHANSAPDHEPIQGKQYTDKEYTQLNNSLARRIGTLNCGHLAFPIICGVNLPQYTDEQLKQFKDDNAKGITYDGKHYTGYEAQEKQRQIERLIREQKNKCLVYDATGDKEKLQSAQIRLGQYRSQYGKFTQVANLRTQNDRLRVEGFGKSEADKAAAEYKAIAKRAEKIYNLGDEKNNISAYLRDKQYIDLFDKNDIEFIYRISDTEIIVNAGKPTITKMSLHAVSNFMDKPDRTNMTMETAQSFVDLSKLTLYQIDKMALKFLSDNGYTVLNLRCEIITAVPQKWRKKYDKYLK